LDLRDVQHAAHETPDECTLIDGRHDDAGARGSARGDDRENVESEEGTEQGVDRKQGLGIGAQHLGGRNNEAN
jgi:hypothetical protein